MSHFRAPHSACVIFINTKQAHTGNHSTIVEQGLLNVHCKGHISCVCTQIRKKGQLMVSHLEVNFQLYNINIEN